MLTVTVGGRGYLRVADAHWSDPLDASHAANIGQRWNPPGTPCLYFNQDRQTVEANLRRKYGSFPYATFLDPATAPVILDVELPTGLVADAYTHQGLSAVGLPPTYPFDGDGVPVPHQPCQAVGQASFDAGLQGVDCKSAVAGGNRELAWFPRGVHPRVLARQTIDDWQDADTSIK